MQKTKVLVLGKNKKSVSKVKKLLSKYKNLVKSKEPSLIISLGGDGTFFYNERKFPSIPKLLVRDNSICRLCSIYEIKNIEKYLNKLNNNKFELISYDKILCQFKDKKIQAVNDIVIRNKNQYEAIRFDLFINNKRIYENIIGDGVIICTSFGSTGYYNSITKSKFTNGIGLALNNVNKNETKLNIKEKDIIKFKLKRGFAIISSDNDKKLINLKDSDEVVIKKSKDKAFIVLLK